MAFDPFADKAARSIVESVCKSNSLARFKKIFDKVVQTEMSVTNLNLGGVSIELGEQCLALAEIVATGRGNGGSAVKLPLVVEDWLEKAPAFDDRLASAAKASVDKVRTNSASAAIVSEMGGWPEWKNYCRGLSGRLGTPAKQRKKLAKPDAHDPVRLLRAKECQIEKENGEPVELRATEAGQLTDADLEQVARLKKLKILVLREQKITDKGLPVLSALKQLSELQIDQCQIKGRGFRDLDLPRLQNLRFGRTGTNAVLANCGHFSGLREVDVFGSDVNDKGLESLAQFKSLERIDVGQCGRLKGAGFKQLVKLKKLKEISAVNVAFSPVGMKALCEISSLRNLCLLCAKLPLSEIASLGKLKQLLELDLGDVGLADKHLEFLSALRRLKVLNLSGNPKVTDQTVELLSRLPGLEELSLSETGVTAASEETLSRMKKLRELDVSATGISRAAEKRLQRNLNS